MICCLKCKEKNRVVEYVGESSRTGFDRGDNHLVDLRSEREGKPLWQHSQEEHGGLLVSEDFKMKVLKKYKTPLERQIGEALEIERRTLTADVLLNKRGEWNGTRVPRLRLESIEEEVEQVQVEEVETREEKKIRIKRMRKLWKKPIAGKRRKYKCDDNCDNEDAEVKGREIKRRKTEDLRGRQTQACQRDIMDAELEDDRLRQT